MGLDNLRREPPFAELCETLKRICAGKRVIYAPNVGNWGDGLIHTGTLQFLESMGIDAELRTQATLLKIAEGLRAIEYRMPDVVVLAGGGGAWCKNWSGSRNFVAKMRLMVDHVVVLPTTYELDPLDDADGRVTYFARDAHESLKVCPEATFCHDMAFFLDFDIAPPPARGETGYFFRQDKERHPSQKIVGDGYDLSGLGGEMKTVVPLFKILRGYGKIVTDRLHVGIAASLLGIETELYPGNYAKIEGVHQSSIAGYYSKTRLMPWQ
ncbi:polysaccharide pyruvyl transferase family protein [Bosea sp. 117]|uniref:polysaccharide pyruvyl transferase family protein n=1 Tax=Bosea sp. 117 TaxID=1125973 RepID=UPI0004949106|nr:polysaccharide pyruvyl transferase family protein [Bosea sp. 117]